MDFRPSGIGLWDIDASLRTTDANVALTRILLVPREDLIGRSAVDFVDPRSRAQFDAVIRDVGQGRIRSVVLKTGDDSELIAGIAAEPRPGGGFTLVVTDMSVEHDELRLIELRGNAIMNSLHSGVVVSDAMGRIERVNPAAERIFGREFLDMVGQNVGILMPEDVRLRHGQYMMRYLETRDAQALGTTREVVGLRADGTTFPLEITLAEASEGDQTYFVAICRDLTDRKAIEAQIAQREAELVKLYRALMKAQEALQAQAKAPTAAPAKAAPPPPAPPPPPLHKLLLIGKDKQLVNQAKAQAEKACFAVIHSESGRQAMTDFGAIRPHLVFVCFYTSDMQGQMVGKFIAGTEEAKGIPIVLLVPPALKGTSDFKAFEAFKNVVEFPTSDAELLKLLQDYHQAIKL